jgi:RNA polymerase sigma-70 factor (ECF subfamily)
MIIWLSLAKIVMVKKKKGFGSVIIMYLNSFDTSYAALDDFDLVLACQKKNAAAFSILYNRYQRYTYGVLKGLAPDLAQIHDDMVQEIFVRVWKSIGTLRNPKAFKIWLKRLTTNMFYDELRKRPKELAISIDEPRKDAGDDDGPWLEIADDKAQPDESFERKEIIMHVKEALDLLPEQFRNVIVLREFYGLTYEEIAVNTKTEIGTVKSRVARARGKIQSYLEQLNCA